MKSVQQNMVSAATLAVVVAAGVGTKFDAVLAAKVGGAVAAGALGVKAFSGDVQTAKTVAGYAAIGGFMGTGFGVANTAVGVAAAGTGVAVAAGILELESIIGKDVTEKGAKRGLAGALGAIFGAIGGSFLETTLRESYGVVGESVGVFMYGAGFGAIPGLSVLALQESGSVTPVALITAVAVGAISGILSIPEIVGQSAVVGALGGTLAAVGALEIKPYNPRSRGELVSIPIINSINRCQAP